MCSFANFFRTNGPIDIAFGSKIPQGPRFSTENNQINIDFRFESAIVREF
jgi:hypothetical protein